MQHGVECADHRPMPPPARASIYTRIYMLAHTTSISTTASHTIACSPRKVSTGCPSARWWCPSLVTPVPQSAAQPPSPSAAGGTTRRAVRSVLLPLQLPPVQLEAVHFVPPLPLLSLPALALALLPGCPSQAAAARPAAAA